jgi:putative ABC transport system permease protein
MRLEQWFYILPHRVRSIFRRLQVDRELDDELQLHIEQKIEQYLAQGLSPREARYAALRDMDGLEQRKEECRDMRKINFIDDVARDLSHGVRVARKNPGFTAVAVFMLGLGIGATTAMFSVANAILLRPLPYPGARQLVRVWGTNLHNGNFRAWASYPNLEDWRRLNNVFSALGASRDDEWTWTGGDEPRQVEIAQVTAEFFSVLGMRPALGRNFSQHEFQNGHENVAIVSHSFWESHLGSDPQALNRSLTLEDRPYTIVGVLPKASFSFPSPAIDVWVPLPVDSPDSSRGSRNLSAIARLRPGVSLTQAQVEISAIASRLEKLFPDANAGIGVRLEPLQEAMVGDHRRLLEILLGVAGFVLLIACINVANLLLSRIMKREREIAVRIALGASRARVMRQLLTESLLLSFLGGAAGYVLAAWCSRALIALGVVNFPRQLEIGSDGWVLFFAVVVSVVPGLLIGLIPAIQFSRPTLAAELKEGASGAGETRRRGNFRSALVVLEVALSLILLTGAGLLLNSLRRLMSVSPGFRPENVLTLRVSLSPVRYPDQQRALAFYQRALEDVAALPGVESAGIVSMLPLSGGRLCNEMAAEGLPMEKIDCVESRSISPDYFQVMKIPLLEGRALVDRDSEHAPRVAVINETLAHLLAPAGAALGKRVSFRGDVRQVVGVVGDVYQMRLSQAIGPEIYLPLRQQPFSFASFVVRAAHTPENIANSVHHELRALDKDLLIYDVQTMEAVVSRSVAQPRVRSLLLAGFATLALLLAVLGLAGVVSYIVGQRTHEFGIRMALGAHSSQVLRMVIFDGMRLAVAGIAIGLAASVWLARFLGGMLFGVGPMDAVTFVSSAVILLAAALVACWIPARRATKVDPLVALHYE